MRRVGTTSSPGLFAQSPGEEVGVGNKAKTVHEQRDRNEFSSPGFPSHARENLFVPRKVIF